MGQLQQIESKLVELGYQIFAISPDLPANLQQSVEKHGLKYLLLSDSKMTASRAFGIAYRVDHKTLALYKGYGIDLEKASGESHQQLPVPAVFVLGTDGTIKFEYVNPDYRVRIDPDELLAEAQVALG